MKIQFLISFAMILAISACKKPGETVQSEAGRVAPIDQPPAWAKEVVWYEIAVERFRNGDTTNDPIANDIQGAYPGFVPEGWSVTPWTHDWYEEDPYMENIGNLN